MNRREQAIEIAAKAHAEYDILRWRIETEDSDEELPSGGVFGAIADALLAAGVIPAEGDVIVKANAWDRFLFAVEAVAPCQRRINRREEQRENDKQR